MRLHTATLLVVTLALAAGCQETGTTGQSATTTSAGASGASSTGATESSMSSQTATGEATGAASAAGATATDATSDLLKTDKSMEVAVPGGGTATIQYTDMKIGNGSIAAAGRVAMVHYTGWLTNGTKFDSSRDRDQPFQFRIGQVPPAVIEGWDKGLRGMRVGGRRKLVIPPELGYGARGYPPVIPPNATLVFDVELIGIE